jgi:MFS family permease
MQNDTQQPMSSEAIPNPPKFYLIGCSLVTALGGLLFGFDTAVVAGTTGWLKSNFALSDAALGFTVASALIGTMAGSLAVGKPADLFGRKIILIVLALFYLVSALGCAFAGGWWEFVTFRFIGGIAVGGASVMAPMYIAEISPARLRGRLVAITQFNVVFGILLAYLSNWGINHFFGELLGESQYRWMFGVEAFPALAFFLLLMLTPQSPRWLVAKQREEEARGILLRCGTDGGSVEEEIRDSLDLTHHSLKEAFLSKEILQANSSSHGHRCF